MFKRITPIIAGLAVALVIGIGFAAPTSAQQPNGPVMIDGPTLQKLIKEMSEAGVGRPQKDYGPFDGKKLYKAALDAVNALHQNLADPKVREAWHKEWSSKYATTKDLDTEEGTDKAIEAMLASLKVRYDTALDIKATKDEGARVKSVIAGIGAQIKLSRGEEIAAELLKKGEKITEQQFADAMRISPTNQLIVDEPMPGSPAEKVLQPGDRITHVNGEAVDGKTSEEAVTLIKGDVGTEVKITFERNDPGTGKVVSDTKPITRALVPIPVVKSKDMGDGITHVRLANFSAENSVAEMHKALKAAGKGKALVLDFRGNPGGNLDYVMSMLPLVLEEGTILVTKFRAGDEMLESQIIVQKDFILRIEPSDETGEMEPSMGKRPKLLIPTDMPVVVLVNEGSASASEIFAGALQHNKRAVVVGKPSHGKGVGQTVVPLPWGRSLHITSFEFIPGRTPNDKVGVIPDVEVERGSDPAVDPQLITAKELAVKGIKDAEARKVKRDELHKKYEKDYEDAMNRKANP